MAGRRAGSPARNNQSQGDMDDVSALAKRFEGEVVICVSDDEAEEEKNLFSEVVVFRVIGGRKVSKEALVSTLRSAWKASERIEFTEVEDGIISAKFTNPGDKDYVMRRGPWSFEGWTIEISEWKPGRRVEDLFDSRVVVTVQLYGMPMERRNQKYATRCLEAVGMQVTEDSWEELNPKIHERNVFVRWRAAMSLDRPVPRGCVMTSNAGTSVWVTFRYEKLPTLCLCCGFMDHDTDHCARRRHEGRRYGEEIRAYPQYGMPMGSRGVIGGRGGRGRGRGEGRWQVNQPEMESSQSWRNAALPEKNQGLDCELIISNQNDIHLSKLDEEENMWSQNRNEEIHSKKSRDSEIGVSIERERLRELKGKGKTMGQKTSEVHSGRGMEVGLITRDVGVQRNDPIHLDVSAESGARSEPRKNNNRKRGAGCQSLTVRGVKMKGTKRGRKATSLGGNRGTEMEDMELVEVEVTGEGGGDRKQNSYEAESAAGFREAK